MAEKDSRARIAKESLAIEDDRDAWNDTSWPNADVIDQQDVIRYKGFDRNRIPAAIKKWRAKRE